MMRAIAYRWQEVALGGLSKVTLRRLTTLANQLESVGRIAPIPGPRIKAGSRLIREWNGRTHTVNVTDDGFEFQGKTFGSLTKIAFGITGAHWSGPRFFGLTKPNTALILDGADEVSGGDNLDSADGAADAHHSASACASVADAQANSAGLASDDSGIAAGHAHG